MDSSMSKILFINEEIKIKVFSWRRKRWSKKETILKIDIRFDWKINKRMSKDIKKYTIQLLFMIKKKYIIIF
jgi:hypothetical protein